jgi:hypothetical protein
MRMVLAYSLLLGIFLSACGRQTRELDHLEQRAADTIAKFLALHEGKFADARVTNVAQVFALMELSRSHRTHPHTYQTAFRKFGKYSGFTNSFYDKYICLQPVLPITNGLIRGELYVISASPYPGLDGQPCRVIIWKAGRQDYRIGRLTESRIHALFHERGVPLPPPTPSPPVPVPDDAPEPVSIVVRAELFFKDLAENYGPGRFFWFPMMLICIGVVLAALILTFIWFSRRRHR